MTGLAGRRIGPYELVRELGRGGMGVVYVAHDPSLDRYVALKLILDPALAGPEEVGRLRQEARAAARLRHPNIVSVQSQGMNEGRPYVVMDLVEGEALSARVQREGPPPPREAARLAARLARGLEHAHAAAVVHRDLKPANVIVDARGEPVLVDFGLARLLDRTTRLTETGTVLGTPAYMAPEQAAGDRERCGPPTDVYALGATLYHLLAGRPPFEGASHLAVLEAVATRAPAPPSSLRPGVDPALEAICLRCMAKSPAQREPAGRVAEALEAWLARGGAADRGRRAPPSTIAWAAAGAALVVASVLGRGVVTERRRADDAASRAAALQTRASQAEAALARSREEHARVLEATRAEVRAGLEEGRQRVDAMRRRVAEAAAAVEALQLRTRAKLAVIGAAGDEALEHLDRALGAAPEDRELLALRAFVEAQRGEDRTVQPTVERVLQGGARGGDPATVTALAARACARRNARDFGGATADARAAVDAAAGLDDPALAQPLAAAITIVGEATLARGDAAAALRAAEDALRLNRLYVPAAGLRARALDAAGRSPEAVHAALLATVIGPTVPRAWLLLAELAEATDPARARAAADQAVSLAPRMAAAWSARGRVRLAADDAAGALEDLGRAIELDPDDVDARLVRAQAAASAGRWALVLEDGEKVRAALPLNHPARPGLEELLERARRERGAGR